MELLARASDLKAKTRHDRGLDVPACMGLPTGRIALHMGRIGLGAAEDQIWRDSIY